MSLAILVAPFRALRRVVNPNEHSQFWLSQIFAIIATVLGVYLAANSGFWQAVKFEDLLHSRDKFYLATSLESELRDNNRLIEIQIKKIEKNKHFNHQGRPIMAQFIWGIMKEDGTTLALPPMILTETRRYYQNIDYAFNNYRQIDSKNDKDMVHKVLTAESKRINKVVAKLGQYRKNLYKQLKGSDIQVDMSI